MNSKVNNMENPKSPILVGTEALVNVLGVVYAHRKTDDGGDMYFTRFGLPKAELLALDNWYDKPWFEEKREHLMGTGAVYYVPTKPRDGEILELVVKNCRVGEDVPLDTHTLMEFINAEFNSPWEEFSLVMELREGKYGPPDCMVKTQEPLAIYVPPERMQLWQSGRSRSKMNKIMARHPGIDLDILRQYKLIYGWIKGKNVVDLLMGIGLQNETLVEALMPLTKKSMDDLEKKGFVVADMKPQHIIIGEEFTAILDDMKNVHGDHAQEKQLELITSLVAHNQYSVVDYELLLRSPKHEEEVKSTRRHSYLDYQRDRFIPTPLPPHLDSQEIFGVPYIHGQVESTQGQLWVVGKNSRLFDYFLPERWRKTPSWKLSEENEVYYTVTKDNIHVVWETSRVGETPGSYFSQERFDRAAKVGFNSPFEEFAIAQELSAAGIPTVYVRAIYMTGTLKSEQSTDLSRYQSHSSVKNTDGTPILLENRNYISIRGFYNGQDVWVAKQSGGLQRPMDLKKAAINQLITAEECREIQARVQKNLFNAGFDGSLLEPNDILCVIDSQGQLLKNAEGMIEARICNFEFIRKLPG